MSPTETKEAPERIWMGHHGSWWKQPINNTAEYIRKDVADAAVAALARSVEWVDRGDHHTCPGCGNWKENGHHPECVIRNALQGGRAELDAAVEQARRDSDTRAERLNEYFCYWLLRAYQSGHREGWEEGPSVAQTMTDLLHVLANSGFDPSGAAAKELLKKKMAYFLGAAAKEK